MYTKILSQLARDWLDLVKRIAEPEWFLIAHRRQNDLAKAGPKNCHGYNQANHAKCALHP
jgi:hypothetical protein